MYIYPRTLVPRDIFFLQQIIRDNLNGLFHLAFSGLDVQLGIERRLVRRRNSCKLFDFTGSCLFIKPFRVALFHNVEGRIDEDFNKVETGVLVDLANKRAIIAIGRDERGQRYTRSVRKQARDLADSADVFVAGLLIKSEIFIQAETDVVPVQSVREFAQMEQMLLESACDRGLAAGAEPSQPDCDPLLLQEVHPLLDVDRSRMECNISSHCHDVQGQGEKASLVMKEGTGFARHKFRPPETNWLQLLFSYTQSRKGKACRW